jgi:ABC-type proline/glycine betaine transport system ATPase subunit
MILHIYHCSYGNTIIFNTRIKQRFKQTLDHKTIYIIQHSNLLPKPLKINNFANIIHQPTINEYIKKTYATYLPNNLGGRQKQSILDDEDLKRQE